MSLKDKGDQNSPRQGRGFALRSLGLLIQFSLLSLPFINLILIFVFALVNYFCCDKTMFWFRGIENLFGSR